MLGKFESPTLAMSVAETQEGKTEDEALIAALKSNTKEDTSVSYSSLVDHIKGDFNRSKDARLTTENRWMTAYKNYRGIYDDTTRFTDREKSQVFIKITKSKVIAGYTAIMEVLFAGDQFPITIMPTKVPEGIAEKVHFDPKDQTDKAEAGSEESGQPEEIISPYGFPGDGNDILPGQTLEERLGLYKDKLKGIKGLKEGGSESPSAVIFEPAAMAAALMDKQIQDQLEETSASKHLRSVVFENVLFGTGVMKGPFAQHKMYNKWNKSGKFVPVEKTVPKVEYVSVWNSYNDPDATTMDDSDFFIQRHKMSRTQLRALKKRPLFIKHEIDSVIEEGPNYITEWWEDTLNDNETDNQIERWEVLEYWGVIDKDLAEEAGLTLPKEFKKKEEIQINAWVCANRLLRLVINPFTPNRIPYQAVPHEHNPYSFWGVGMAENMDDTQTLMNGFMRLAVDNAALSGNLIFEVNEDALTPGQDLEIYPGKVFIRQNGAPGQAIFSTQFQNVSQQNMQMFDVARRLADESTGFPSYAHGMTGVQGTGRTAAGISMLMNAAQGSIKAVIKNFDDYLLAPLGEALFAFNMQFNFKEEYTQGDLEVKARGTDSLVSKEVLSQRLIQFIQIASNQIGANFVKFNQIYRELCISLGLDPDKYVNNPDEAKRQAQLMQEMGINPQQQGGMPMASGSPPGGPNGNGGANIGVGQAPGPQEPGFTGQPPQGQPQGGM